MNLTAMGKENFDLQKYLVERFDALDVVSKATEEEIRLSRQERAEFHAFRDRSHTTLSEYHLRLSGSEENITRFRAELDELKMKALLMEQRLLDLESGETEWDNEERDTIVPQKEGVSADG